ncbi:hypothetical protein Cci01nite_43980 [Catellatospora citrea]|uniref:RNA polymerase sigma-70 factor (Sigma-E family) n=1 Tax=Catellatospora citrea TaxID=53366 RepID=A0A8J3KNS8_9ACTN|nr:RNA polymerase sigma-70 factor (sigma-E family) [Catellatospora citrea]GIF99304.1 hypothetical protein Cci01nite_43980 [Catellatospora citrea]
MSRYDGFHEFVVARGGALSRTAFLLTGEHHAAEDLVQTALAKAAVRWRQIMEYGQPEAYVRRIMVNEQISWWRRRPARPMAELPDRAGPDEPGRVVERVVLTRALATLAPRQRAVLVLRYYEDLSEADTAAAMGCSVGTVKSQTNLALTNLRRSLPLVAEHAGQYADAHAALATARRRRTRPAGAAAVLTVLPLLLGAVWYALAGATPAPPPVTSSPSPSAPAPSISPVTLPPLPAAVPPADVLPDLPADRGVRGGALLLTKQNADDPVHELLGGDGRRYRLPSAPTGGFTVAPILSPDGRWLLWSSPQGTVARDLTASTVHRLPYELTQAQWSPSGTWLFAQRYPEIGEVLVRTADWSAHEFIPSDAARPVAAVLDSGELLRLGQVADTMVTLDRVDPLTGAARRITVDLRGVLRADESAVAVRTDHGDGTHSEFAFILPAADGTAGVEISRSGPGLASPVTAVVRFAVADGRVLRRTDLSSSGSVSRPLCFRGTDLLWTDGTHIIGAGAYRLPLDPVYGYSPPGCIRDANLVAAG